MALRCTTQSLRRFQPLLVGARGMASVSDVPAKAPVIDVPQRFLMGPGPSNSHPRALAAMALPQLGHMHPPFLKIMDEISEYTRYLMQTDSKYTCAISGSGHMAMEASIANLLEPGEKILVGENGTWGIRVADLSARFGLDVIPMKKPAGETFSLAELTAALDEHKPKALFLCHGESSAGTMQQIEGVGAACQARDCFLIVDTVCTLGGVPFHADKWGVDVVYSGAQKALSCPPGASPLMFSEKAMAKVKSRSTPVRTYNADLTLIGDYWGWFGGRSYHHTGPISNFYALREAMAVTSEEGLEPLWARHQAMYELLWEGLEKLGLERFVKDEASRLPTVNTIVIPEGVDGVALCGFAMKKYNLEIAGGLGPTAGKVWRIGVMGYNAHPMNVNLVIKAFEEGLAEQGWKK
mmetsp:Transcript_31341/g.43476  ORF Transcript_31341/g.43476 Transcript_31341/m.43476 type:complete len:409 (+) Transcript_31341:205-1431(+)|eukprot:CAMPEP_0196571676 /NCGR_PEP_ID=MMETSP1081-20130531/1819_1 /TAXON_ID=36882 /ORGANISM="Pyramimonas amylifera, Strain CCMP720" /LENGTH=408 /DNA_ID=CAMNT_0041888709 /DNA_START=194 /DNA_END=1420 /DNA_ORIENTATION=-